MRKIKIMWRILKTTGIDKIIIGFLIFVFVAALILQIVEPGISTYFDGIWYSFITLTTVGYGDIAAVTVIGKIISMLLAVSGVIVVALIPGTLVNFYQEITKLKAKDSMATFLDKLERLPELSKEELEEIAENVKQRKYRL